MISAIVASGWAGEIGHRGVVPWLGRVPNDMKHFRAITRGGTLVMGRVTADSIKLPLAGRTAIIVTSRVNETLERHGGYSLVVDSFNAALALVPDDKTSIYRQALQTGVIDVLYRTVIHGNFKADAFFSFDRTAFELASTRTFPPDEKNEFGCTFEVLKKIV